MSKTVDGMEYRLAYRMALADGELSANEETVLDVLAQSFGFDEATRQRLAQQADLIDYDNLRRVFPERDQQLRLFETACLLAMADGRSDLEEWHLANRLTAALRIERAEAAECLERARARLRELARQHRLSAEIRANLQKLGLA
jgi:uncharacterized tellurite resistance protein B-like protein